MLWLHATSPERLRALCDVAALLKAGQDDLFVLATWDSEIMLPPPQNGPECDRLLPLPAGSAGAARQFLATWHPDVGVWTGGHLHGSLIRGAADAGTDMILIDPDPVAFEGQKRRWFSDPLQNALGRFQRVLAGSDEAVAALRRAGCAADKIETAAPLRNLPILPEGPDEDVSAISQELAGRPVWFAAFPHPDEFGFVLTAQRNAVRWAHRLLLIILLENRANAESLAEMLDGMTLRHARWHLGDPIGDLPQVLVADDPEDLGLWYRIAPQTFLGHTFVADGGGRNPLEAAALGSAVLHGPETGPHADAFARLSRAGGAHLVRQGQDLGAEVARLTAPDIASHMAMAGWDVATEGAELTSRVVALVKELLDNHEAA